MYGAPTTQSELKTASTVARRNLTQVRRHDTYYLKGGDLHVMIDDVIFRVHRYFFIRESAYFREELEYPASPGQPSKGNEDSNAIIIAEDRQGRPVHAIDFEKFLWVFYNPLYSLYDACVEDWSRILHLANTWRFHEVKSLCVRELQRLEMPSVDRIELYQNFEVDQTLLIPCYAEVCARETALTVGEGEQLGMKTAMLLMQARERARARDATRSPLPAEVRSQQVVSLVEEMFGISSPPGAEPPMSPLPSNILFSGSNAGKTNGVPTTNGVGNGHTKNKSSGGGKPSGILLDSDSRHQAQSFDALFNSNQPTTTSQTPPPPPKKASEEQKTESEEPKPKLDDIKTTVDPVAPKPAVEETKPKIDEIKTKTAPAPPASGIKNPLESTASGKPTSVPGSAVNQLQTDAHAEGAESGTDAEGPASPTAVPKKKKKTGLASKLSAKSVTPANSTGPAS